MKNRHTKPKENRNKDKTESRQDLDNQSPAKNLLKLLITISNRHKSFSAEKSIKQKIADIIVDDTFFRNDFSDHLDDDYQPIKIQLFFKSLKYKNIIINELISSYKRDKNTASGFIKKPQVIIINPIQLISVSRKDKDAIFNFKKSKIPCLKEIQQSSSSDNAPKIYDHAMRNMFLLTV